MTRSAFIALAVLLIGSSCYGADQSKRTPRKHDAAEYEEILKRIEARRLDLARRYRKARTNGERGRIRHAARRYVERTVFETIFPAWLGTPWGLGRNSTATRPHQPGMTVGCSYFVTSVLQNAGLRLDNRFRFARAPALHIQRSLAPSKKQLHRYGGLSPRRLERRIRGLGDGLYLVGLNIHVGFVVVHRGRVQVVHASYTPPRTVVDEPLTTSSAIHNSQSRGYYISSLFQDQRLILHWLEGRPVKFAF